MLFHGCKHLIPTCKSCFYMMNYIYSNCMGKCSKAFMFTVREVQCSLHQSTTLLCSVLLNIEIKSSCCEKLLKIVFERIHTHAKGFLVPRYKTQGAWESWYLTMWELRYLTLRNAYVLLLIISMLFQFFFSPIHWVRHYIILSSYCKPL